MDRKRLLLLTLAVLLGIAALVAWLGRQDPQIGVTYAQASRGPITREVLTGGTLEPAREVEVGAQVSGTVQSIHADFNDRVTAGQLLARLDPSVFNEEVAQARGRVTQADADVEAKRVILDDARTKVARARELRGQDLLTQAELDAAELAARQAEANLTASKAAAKSARAGLAAAEVDRGHTVIRSPIDGVVVNRSVEVGQTLASRMQAPVLFRIADLRQMQMLTEISEAEVGSVRQGSDVRFEIESLGPRQFHGTVAEVRLAPVLQSAVGTSGGSGNGRAGTATATGTAATTGTTAAPAAAGATTQSTGAPSAAGSSPAGSAQAAQGGSTTSTAPAGSVVSYTAIVNVDNREYGIAPGTTAVVTLPTAQRNDVLRVPNNALAFRPSVEALAASGQKGLDVGPARDDERPEPARGRIGHVWKFENGKFAPVEVRTGASDETWTEILSGAVQPGDRLVTSATAR